jgi:hypothetical protein
MLGNHSVYQIHRRRQSSTSASPASPNSTWHTRGNTSPSTRRDESSHHVVTASAGSPAVNVDVPSPIFDLPSFSTAHSKTVRSESFGLPRSSEEHVQRQNARPTADPPRPATSASHAPRLDIPQTGKRRVFSSSPLDSSYSFPRPLSSHGVESPSPDAGARYNDRVYTSRNFSHSSFAADSSPVDETPTYKLAGGKKSRLNLLNPMSLLARRRSSQIQNKLEDVGLHVTTQSVPAIPDDYDPRIRGNIVHDFSAPRPRRVQSSLDSPTFQTALSVPRPAAVEHIRRASDLSGLEEAIPKRTSQSPNYSPVFKEHFQDDRQNLRPAQTGYLHSLALSGKNGDISNANVPAFAKKLPVLINEDLQFRQDGQSRAPPPPPKEEKPLQKYLEAALEDRSAPHADPMISERKVLPPITSLRRASGLPKHMTSTSSRFSFIGNGDSAAQEKLLEEKHKQHANNNDSKAAPQFADEGQEDDDYEDYDFDADDGFEEQIPGVNADAGDDEETFMPRPISLALNPSNKRINLKIDPGAANDYARKDNLQSFHFTPDPSVLSSVSTGQTSQPTPRDEDGRVIGLADTSYSPRRTNDHSRQRSDLSIVEVSGGLAGLGLSTTQPDTKAQSPVTFHMSSAQQEPFRDEDLYFDDGEFDEMMDDVNGEELDERIFDDGNVTIRDIPAENARKLEEAQLRSSLGKAFPAGLDYSVMQVGFRPQEQQQQTKTSPSAAAADGVSAVPDAGSVGLTEGNLAAYHAALVSAADVAAANGRFMRSVSNSRYSEDQTSTSQLEDSPPGLSNDDKRHSHNVEFSGIDDDENFPFDDDGEDDLIAEANAEVLENDDDGFYGQEFGFYARAKGKNTSELEYGGYFAPRGSNGIKRSHSAKANFQEPTLTPITERSEWSTRNSVASLHIPGMPSSAQSIPSPGIAQLLDFESSSFDENMSFEALMKLRRGAFGGSSTSINSLGGPPSSSPLAHVSAHSFAGADAGHRMTSSITSLTTSAGIPESEEEDNDRWEEPKFTRNTPTEYAEASDLRTPESTTTYSPISARSDKGRMGHSRNSSGAESVSYVRDTDGRWLLERRRTGDDGEGEVIEREYLAGSRI